VLFGCSDLFHVWDQNTDKTVLVCEKEATVGGDRRSNVKMRLVHRLEQWTLYPMMVLWVAAFIMGFYDAYRYLANNL
jgi:hypothetical protein